MIGRGVIYEPHPVSAERKAELKRQGLTIVDVVFKEREEKRIQEEEALRIAAAEREAESDRNKERMREFFNSQRRSIE